MSYQPQKEDLVEVMEDLESTDLQDLIVYNDDYNTFDHVTNTLIKVCKHDKLQAEQCTWIIHYKGKCGVKKGSLPELKPMKEAILEAGINAEIL
ncbi:MULTISPECIES: ATP-dependent Clp protease adaptor ClpS [unclassified Imperialibacter]|jgi:ATP-dependent Clp protease adaptor protein ClpS|uniref:ATP-dependent Clp protease adaptor ClpS n=1 Tax=unclassified Imperialibacter TaxID=2629706 RepID=UPI0012511DB5|nr:MULTISPECIES: ATP-dependent Clp protease adaptor ClpS [unclassified Imperialibacter]CAD5271003.1 Clp protease ClpS [Imperialibacter sp. 75]CAD5298623.1 Clp protease ClpS [Imperialibacter sp. 89]VVT35662.1 Clp protease ClpS [Imperialibacter sp. EC-SDR9]